MTRKSTPPDVSKAIGQAVRRRRVEQGLTQDQLAERIRAAGLQWSSSVLASLEAGRKKVDIGEGVLLARAMDVSLGDLIESDQVELVPGVTVSGANLQNALKGPPLPDTVGEHVDAVFAEAKQDSVVALARRIGVSPSLIGATARHLWGRGFLSEREARVAERATPGMPATVLPHPESQDARARQGIRGHVTREMYDELVEQIAAIAGEPDGDKIRRAYRGVKA